MNIHKMGLANAFAVIESGKIEAEFGGGALPQGMSECDTYGMTWGCDKDCPVYQRGECPIEDELYISIDEEYLNDKEEEK